MVHEHKELVHNIRRKTYMKASACVLGWGSHTSFVDKA